MITMLDAGGLLQKHLGRTPRAMHSRFVAHAMVELAKTARADPELWATVGLCHDIDYDVTAADRSKHGILAAQWLAGRLPPEALEAIAAHDHRTGVKSSTLLADMLKLADVLALIDQHLGRGRIPDLEKMLQSKNPEALEPSCEALRERPYLLPMLLRLSKKHRLSFRQIRAICHTAPLQAGP